MIFERNRSELDKIKDRYLNSGFHKTGFIDENVYNTKNRDIWPHWKRLLADPNATIFSSILIGVREVPYSEELLQSIELREYELNKKTRMSDIYASVKLNNYRFFECLFITSPLNWKKSIKGTAIQNTLKRLEKEFGIDWQLIPETVNFLKEQLKINTVSPDDPQDDLFLKKRDAITTVTLLVPMLTDNTYYSIDGMQVYPFLSEKYHHNKTSYDQIKFSFKIFLGTDRKYAILPGYFHEGRQVITDPTTGEITYLPILYCRCIKFYNPFFFFDPPEIEKLMKELMDEKYLSPHVKKLLQNNYDYYIANISQVRAEYGNKIPTIQIHKENDDYYEKIAEKMAAEKEEVIDVTEEDDDIIEEVDDNEEETSSSSNNNESVWTISRKTMSMKTLKSLIMGYNGVKFYSFYPHLDDALLEIMDPNDSGGRGSRESSAISPTQAPKSKQIQLTLKSNPSLCCSYDSSNPFDIFFRTIYKKTLLADYRKDAGVKTAQTRRTPKVADVERYLTWDEYGKIDSWTVKNPGTSGLVSTMTSFNLYDWIYRFDPDEDY